MLINGSDYYIYTVPFANTANPAIVVTNDDGTYTVYLNSLLDNFRLQKALAHELAHIERNHFYSDDDIELIESDAIAGESYEMQKLQTNY